MSAVVWPPAGSLVWSPPCTYNRPKPVRIRRPRKVYVDMNARPIFLKPSEAADWTAEELCAYRKDWGTR
ncbi:hypothetical protein PP639_gp043 [Arthrobacter phage Seahorse]|uniref:Uncharacterized protein n=1 Tax=Arthrobacter phage Seahorse TaxID=2419611 RepID=A0A3G3M542_9CAUD|nr:hypothetical protein PP639_gp043 [Arthrobacter phage Seahorse]AYR01543.1 hypothetical protein PBI_SEAHORSE_43 [Arthrobacter phage Seahorse]